MQINTSDFVQFFRSVAPYIHAHRGKTFVIKLPGEVMQGEYASHLIYDLALLNSLGIKIVIVYGARPQINALIKNSDLNSEYHEDLRITDKITMEYVKQAVGSLGLELKARFSTSLGNTPMADASVRISTGNYILAKPMGVLSGIDYQYTGKIRSIKVESIITGLKNNEIIMVPPIGYSSTGEVFNLSADEVANEIAVSLSADKLIYLTDKEGLIDMNGRMTHQLTKSEAEKILENCELDQIQKIRLKRSIYACQNGVKRVHLIDMNIDGSLLQELFSRDGIGTLISVQPFDDIRGATQEDIPGIFELIEPQENDGVLTKRSREKLELDINNYTVLLRDNVIIGCVAIYPFNEDAAAEMACLVIHPDYQDNGRGDELLTHVEKNARANNLQRIFVLTTHALHWFLEHGFNEISVEDLPVERKNLYNYQRNSRVLVKELS